MDVTSTVSRLYNAALIGDDQSLVNLLLEDRFVLDRCDIEKSRRYTSPLHISASLEHVDFTEIILGIRPDLCFARDEEGRNPIHVAAVNGRIEVLRVLLRENRHAVRELTTGGESIMHLCVKYKQLEALKVLTEFTNDPELLNRKDSGGNTAFHLAVALKEPAMVEYFLTHPRIEKNAVNNKGMTAVDTHKQQVGKDSRVDGSIEKSLKCAKAKPAKEALSHLADTIWLDKQRFSFMVVASLMATMAFQVGVHPPGGFWHDDDNGHDAGESIMSYHSTTYNVLVMSNTTGFISSLIVILLLISGLPCKKYNLFVLRIMLWVAMTATACTYFLSLGFVMKGTVTQFGTFQTALSCTFVAWIGLMGIILFGHFLRVLLKKI